MGEMPSRIEFSASCHFHRDAITGQNDFPMTIPVLLSKATDVGRMIEVGRRARPDKVTLPTRAPAASSREPEAESA